LHVYKESFPISFQRNQEYCLNLLKKLDVEQKISLPEMMAMYLYAANLTFACSYIQSLVTDKEDAYCPFSLFHKYLCLGAYKLMKHYELQDEINRKYPIPNKLYKGMDNANIKQNQVNSWYHFGCAFSTTAQYEIAQRFSDRWGTIITFEDVPTAIKQGKLIGAPLIGISPYEDEDEWLVLPSMVKLDLDYVTIYSDSCQCHIRTKDYYIDEYAHNALRNLV